MANKSTLAIYNLTKKELVERVVDAEQRAGSANVSGLKAISELQKNQDAVKELMFRLESAQAEVESYRISLSDVCEQKEDLKVLLKRRDEMITSLELQVLSMSRHIETLKASQSGKK